LITCPSVHNTLFIHFICHNSKIQKFINKTHLPAYFILLYHTAAWPPN
jgi:hypothetical protein